MEKDGEKRARIIEAAIEVFCRAGFDGASVAEIAAKADVGKGTLYLYFDSKVSLFQEVYRVCTAERAQACVQDVEGVSGAIDKLCLRLRNGTAWEMKYPLKNKLGRLYLADPRFGEKDRNDVLSMEVAGVTQILEDGIRSGELRGMPVKLMEEMFYRLGSAVYYYIEDHPQELHNEGLWQEVEKSIRGCLGVW